MLRLGSLRRADIAACVLALRDDDMRSAHRQRASLGEFHALFHGHVHVELLYMDVDLSPATFSIIACVSAVELRMERLVQVHLA